jgi:hypothetical protein
MVSLDQSPEDEACPPIKSHQAPFPILQPKTRKTDIYEYLFNVFFLKLLAFNHVVFKIVTIPLLEEHWGTDAFDLSCQK